MKFTGAMGCVISNSWLLDVGGDLFHDAGTGIFLPLWDTAILWNLLMTEEVVDNCLWIFFTGEKLLKIAYEIFHGWDVSRTEKHYILVLIQITIQILEFSLQNFYHCRIWTVARILRPSALIMTSVFIMCLLSPSLSCSFAVWFLCQSFVTDLFSYDLY